MKFDLDKLEFVDIEINDNKLAISGSDMDLTWEEFKNEVLNLKKDLLSLNLPKNHPIIIYGHKEARFIVTIVACMSLNLPYVPVDTIFPNQRLMIIQDIVKSAVIIKCDSSKIELNEKYLDTSYLREDDPIVYIMFTSGSTGTPKGVQITYGAILSYTNYIKKDFPFNSDDIFMNQAPFSFDLSTYELFSFLMYGATIVTFSRETIKNTDVFINRLKTYSCTVWNTTPSFLTLAMMITEFHSQNLVDLKKFLSAGERLTHKVARKLFKLFPGINLYNNYGPTEGTNASTLVNITEKTLEQYPESLPVGYPKSSKHINLLNTYKEDEKIIGEIQLIGNNVSIGYLNNDTLNKEKFSKYNGLRTFRTGDYGYFKDNMLFFVGRQDDLIKLHGFRIEIGEIDKEIERCKGVTKSVTIPLKRGDEVVKLVSFVLSNEANFYLIKEKLSKKLPYYMIPSDILLIDHFPYNANNKIDKKFLLERYKSK